MDDITSLELVWDCSFNLLSNPDRSLSCVGEKFLFLFFFDLLRNELSLTLTYMLDAFLEFADVDSRRETTFLEKKSSD